MGTDIHMRVERRNPTSGKWEAWREAFLEYGQEGFSWDDDPENRNYRVFAALADVRNGYGFGGIRTHKQVKPWFPGRGLPKDLDPTMLIADSCPGFEHVDGGRGKYPEKRDFASQEEYEQAMDAWHEKNGALYDQGTKNLGEHSFTWATVEELLACPWDIVFDDGGVIEANAYETLKAEGGIPKSWCGSISGPGIIVLSQERYEDFKERGADALTPSELAQCDRVVGGRIIQTIEKEKNLCEHVPPEGRRTDIDTSRLNVHVQAEWKWQPLLNSSFYRWLTNSEGTIQTAIKEVGAENIRILFGFDS